MKHRWADFKEAGQRQRVCAVKLAHDRHHNAHLRIPMVRLTRENIEFAFELLGPYAYDYLHAHYGGTDIRVTNALIRSEADAA